MGMHTQKGIVLQSFFYIIVLCVEIEIWKMDQGSQFKGSCLLYDDVLIFEIFIYWVIAIYQDR